MFRHPPFLFYISARGFSALSYQIATVAVGWQVYAMTNSAFALGMVGLVQFIPSAILVFVAGHAADRYDRTRLMQSCQAAQALTGVFLAWGNIAGWLNVTEIFAALLVIGTSKAFENPAVAALLPGVVPEGLFQKGTALASAVFQVAVISGPALGGLTYALSPAVPYALMGVFWLLASMLNGGSAWTGRWLPKNRRRLPRCSRERATSVETRQSWGPYPWICSPCCSEGRRR